MKTIKKLYKDIHSTKKGSALFSIVIGLPAVFMDNGTTMLGMAFIASWLVYTSLTLGEIEKASFITEQEYA